MKGGPESSLRPFLYQAVQISVIPSHGFSSNLLVFSSFSYQFMNQQNSPILSVQGF